MGSTTRGRSASKEASKRKPSAKRADSKPVRKAGAKKAGSKKTSANKADPKRVSAAPRPRKAPIRRAKPTASAVEVDSEVLEFIAAIDDYKNAHNRPFPSWSEVLHIVKSLGYTR